MLSFNRAHRVWLLVLLFICVLVVFKLESSILKIQPNQQQQQQTITTNSDNNVLIDRLKQQIEEQRQEIALKNKEIDDLLTYSTNLEVRMISLGADETQWECQRYTHQDRHDDPTFDRVLSIEAMMNIQNSRLRPALETKASKCFNEAINNKPIKLMCSQFIASSVNTKYIPSTFNVDKSQLSQQQQQQLQKLEQQKEKEDELLVVADNSQQIQSSNYINVPSGIYNFKNKGERLFEEVFIDSNNIAPSFGSCWGDFNNDGYLDLYVNNHYWAPALYLNLKNGSFENVAFKQIPFLNKTFKSKFVDKHGCSWADFNKDGQLDLFEVTGAKYGTGSIPNNLFRNENGILIEEAALRGVDYPLARARTISWLDYDNDGHLDAFISSQKREDGVSQANSALFRQIPENNTFVNVNNMIDINVDSKVLFVHMTDIDNDGVLEFFLLSFTFPFKVYHTETYPFIDVTQATFHFNMSILVDYLKMVDSHSEDVDTWIPPPNSTGLYAIVSDTVFGDVDGNTWIDIVLARNYFGKCIVEIFYNLGYTDYTKKLVNWEIKEIYSKEGVTCGALALGDFDNDRDLDIFLLTYLPYANSPNVFFMNKGERDFAIKEEGMGAAGSTFGKAESVAVADYDLDGRLDLFITNGKGSPPFDVGPSQLFHNIEDKGRNWIEIDIIGVTENIHGFGGRVFLKSCGSTQIRDIENGVHFSSQNAFRIHFGLGKCPVIDELKVWWPKSKQFQTMKHIKVNQLLIFKEDLDQDKKTTKKST